jgi:uncharacterized protein (TIGR03086 family)
MDLDTLYRTAVDTWSHRVSRIAADQWDLPTPCTDWTVRDLVNHVVGEDLWTPPLLAGRTIEEVGDQFDGDLLGADPIGAAQNAAAAAITATLAALPAGGTVHLSFGETPVQEYVWQLVADHLVHGWDLAAAIGAPRDLDPVAVDEVARWFAQWEEAYRGAGAVGPRPSVSNLGADPQSALLVATGRDPDWISDPSE